MILYQRVSRSEKCNTEIIDQLLQLSLLKLLLHCFSMHIKEHNYNPDNVLILGNKNALTILSLWAPVLAVSSLF